MEQVLFSLPLRKLEPVFKGWIKDVLSENQFTQTTAKENDLLTIDQAAEFLSLTKPTLYSKVSRGELPSMKRGKRLYFSKKELLGYLKAGRRGTISELQEEAHTYLKK